VQLFGSLGMDTAIQSVATEGARNASVRPTGSLPTCFNRRHLTSWLPAALRIRRERCHLQLQVNIFGILRTPRADGTEAMLVMAPWHVLLDGSPAFNNAGIVTLLLLARHAATTRTWAKDVIFLLYDYNTGLPRWLEAYHGESPPSAEFPRTGQIQLGLNLEIPFVSIGSLGLLIEGANGRMPNLDLVNTVVRAAAAERVPLHLFDTPTPLPAVAAAFDRRGHIGQLVAPLLEPLVGSWENYVRATTTLWTGMWRQATGHNPGGHAVALPYRIESLTLRGTFHRPRTHSTPPVELRSIARYGGCTGWLVYEPTMAKQAAM